MLFISLIVAALFGALTAARGLKSPLEGYTVVPMSWNAVNTTDGSEIVLYGTIQELYEQLETLDDVKIGNGTNATSTATNEETRSLTPRSKVRIIKEQQQLQFALASQVPLPSSLSTRGRII